MGFRKLSFLHLFFWIASCGYSYGMRTRLNSWISPSPSSGVYQRDAFGYPVKIAEPGYIWDIPNTPQGLSAHAEASNIQNRGVVLPESLSPNLHYGTIKTMDGRVLTGIPPSPVSSGAAVPSTGQVVMAGAGGTATAAGAILTPPAAPSTGTPAVVTDLPSVSSFPPPMSPPPIVKPTPFVEPAPLKSITQRPEGKMNEMQQYGAAIGNGIGRMNMVTPNAFIPPFQLPSFNIPMMSANIPWNFKKTLTMELEKANAKKPPTTAPPKILHAPEEARKECKRDYENFPCPEGWTNLMHSGACKAPSDYKATDRCPSLKHFDLMGISQRQDFEKRCNVIWPCEGSIDRDCNKCPASWVSDPEKEGWCKPTETYAGPCKRSQKWIPLNSEQKKTLLATCDMQCKPAEVIVGTGVVIAGGFKLDKYLSGTAATHNPTTE